MSGQRLAPFLIATGLVATGVLSGLAFTVFFYAFPAWFDLGERPMQAYGPAAVCMLVSWMGGATAIRAAFTGPKRLRVSAIGVALVGLLVPLSIGYAIFVLPYAPIMEI